MSKVLKRKLNQAIRHIEVEFMTGYQYFADFTEQNWIWYSISITAIINKLKKIL